MFITVILCLFNSKLANRTSAHEHDADSSISCYCKLSRAEMGVLSVRVATRPGMAQLGLFPPLLSHGSSVLKQCQRLNLVVPDVVLGAPGFNIGIHFMQC